MGRAAHSATAEVQLEADVLVVGGGMAACWSAIAAARDGASVVLVDKGFVGTSGVTATAGPGHWFVPPDPEKRRAAIAQREAIAFGLGDARWMARILDQTFRQLPTLEGYYKFGINDDGVKMYGPVRGPEYMRALRQVAESLGVRIVDQSPALELLLHGDGSVAGARGIQRQSGLFWEARAAGVVLATGGCAFGSRLLGSQTNTGDGYLMGAEAGVELSGMEFSSQYVIAPAFSTVTRTMSYAFATYYGPDMQPLDIPVAAGGTRALARHMLRGPVYCDLSRMPEDIRQRLPQISPNVLIPFRRLGIDPFQDKFPVTLICEGTVRGMGGLKIADEDCQTSVQGLYAAGDTASRELVTGATSGGGAVNSAWALSSGYWSGQAAARRARSHGTRAKRAVEAIGMAGLRPRRGGRALDAGAVIESARSEATHYDKNLFRSADKLTRSLAVLDDLWRDVRDDLQAQGTAVARAREAASIVAAARYSYTAALHRRETRGQHFREDAPQLSPRFERRQVLSGLDRIQSSFAREAQESSIEATS
ncbi:MAG: oxidoreductase [Myxococcaceae bacterium]|nr:oxidoreductase [Myxococcaceae bacterium]